MMRALTILVSLVVHIVILVALYLTAGFAGGTVLGERDEIGPDGGVRQVAVLTLPPPPVEEPPAEQAAPLEPVKTPDTEAISEKPPAQVPPPEPKTPEPPKPPAPKPQKKVPPKAPEALPPPDAPTEEEPRASAEQKAGAQSGEGATAPTAGDGGTRTDPSAKRDAENYYRTLMSWLNKHKQYPVQAKKAKQQGVVVVRFTFGRDGTVVSADIKTSSGYAALDEEALGILRRASPLPEMPKTMKQQQLTIALPIEFTLVTE